MASSLAYRASQGAASCVGSDRVMKFLSTCVLGLSLLAIPQSVRAQLESPDTLDRCRALSDRTAMQRCFGEALSKNAPAPTSRSQTLPSGWRLVRTTAQQGGNELISVMRTSELGRSDPGFAGLMLRCAEQGMPDVLLVMLDPVKPRARPTVTLKTRNSESTTEATMVPPFTTILMPKEVASAAGGDWISAPELSVEISLAPEEKIPSLRGAVPLVRLKTAYDALLQACASIQR